MDFNTWIGIGKVEAKPVITENSGKKQAHFMFIVNNRAQNASGQWVDVPMKVPVYAFDKKADVVEKYVVAGQELTIAARYQSWDANGQLGHGMIAQTISLGLKPRNTGSDGSTEAPPM